MSVLTAAMALLHVAGLIAAAFVLPGPDDAPSFLAIIFGVVHAEIALLALWTVFGSRALGLRLLVSAFGMIVIVAAFCAYVIRTGGPLEVCVISAVTFMAQWALMLIPFWLTRRASWDVCRNRMSDPVSPQDSQFHTRHLFIWTTAIAILFAFGNAASPLIGRLDANSFGQWIGFFGVVAVANVLMVGPLIWATLSGHANWIWSGAAMASIGLLTPMEAALFHQLPVSRDLLSHGVRFIVVISLVHAVTIVSALLIVRSYGWRLERTSPIHRE